MSAFISIITAMDIILIKDKFLTKSKDYLFSPQTRRK